MPPPHKTNCMHTFACVHAQDGKGKACIGTAFALNGCSEIMGFWQVATTSLWELRGPLRQLSIRCRDLGKVRG